MGNGRYAELYGKDKIDDDLTTHAFEIPRRSQTQLDQVPAATRKMGEAFAAGLNHYLACHPEVKPRMFTHIEPWHLLAFGRRVYLELIFKASHVGGRYRPGPENEIYEQIGSNAWAVGPSRTKDGTTMLFINPHQPWYGYGQWYEAHVRTKDGIDFYGASFSVVRDCQSGTIRIVDGHLLLTLLIRVMSGLFALIIPKTQIHIVMATSI